MNARRSLPLLTPPITRGDCEEGPRPCPWTFCRYHLGQGRDETCALDVAERGPHTRDVVAELLGIRGGRNSVAITEARALAKLRKRA